MSFSRFSNAFLLCAGVDNCTRQNVGRNGPSADGLRTSGTFAENSDGRRFSSPGVSRTSVFLLINVDGIACGSSSRSSMLTVGVTIVDIDDVRLTIGRSRARVHV